MQESSDNDHTEWLNFQENIVRYKLVSIIKMEEGSVMTRPKRILMIENEPIKIGALRRALEDKGYLIEVITNYEEAKEKLNCKWVPLAIVDIRLVDERNPNDYTGLDLITKESDQAIMKVVLTANPSYEAVREALVAYQGTTPPAVDFLYKQDPINELVDKIEKAFSELGINRDLDVEFDGLQTFVCMADWFHRNMPKKHEDPPLCQGILESAEEFQDLWSKLFTTSNKIIVYPLPSGCGDALVAKIKPYHKRGQGSMVVVKCGWRHCIENEKNKYEEHVRPNLSSSAPTLSAFEKTLHFGGLIYSLAGVGAGGGFEHAERFADFYRAESSKIINRVISNLFETAFLGWSRLKSQASMEGEGVDQEYRLNMKLESKKELLIERFNELCEHAQELDIRLDKRKRLVWANDLELDLDKLLGMVYETQKFVKKEIITPYLERVSHGDLNGGNILVEKDMPPWVIDFSKTGYGYILRDFVHLETVIALDLLRSSNQNELMKFETTVCSQKDWERGFPIPYDTIGQGEPEIIKALKVTCYLRNLAAKKEVEGMMQRYYLALLFETVGRIVTDGRDSPPSMDPLHRRAHAAMRAAALIKAVETE
jgi:CheY-like chemotaxis protein